MIIRLCVAFAINKVIIAEDTYSPGKKSISRISRSGIHLIETVYTADTVKTITSLKEENYRIIGIEITDDSQDIAEYIPPKDEKFVLVFGNEQRGISGETLDLCDLCLHISITNAMSSLNVAMAAAIAIHSFKR